MCSLKLILGWSFYPGQEHVHNKSVELPWGIQAQLPEFTNNSYSVSDSWAITVFSGSALPGSLHTIASHGRTYFLDSLFIDFFPSPQPHPTPYWSSSIKITLFASPWAKLSHHVPEMKLNAQCTVGPSPQGCLHCSPDKLVSLMLPHLVEALLTLCQPPPAPEQSIFLFHPE